jgi:AcrR family transcriptional regulator
MKTAHNESAVAEGRGPGRPRDEEVSKRILDAAEKLLEDVGVTSTTVDAIADLAGASKATVYRWWPNKASVLIDAFRQAVGEELPFPDTGAFEEDIRQQVRTFTSLLMSRKGRLLAAFVRAAQQDPEVKAAFREYWLIPRRAEAKQAMDRHRQRGDMPADMDLDIAIDVLYGPLYYHMLTGYRELSLDYADELVEAALSGLRARK